MKQHLKQIFELCRLNKVQLTVLDEKLQLSFDGDVPNELIVLMKQHKAELMTTLKQHNHQKSIQNELGQVQKIARTDQALPLSSAQQRLWLIDRIEGKSPQYNIPITLQITGKVDVNAIEQALLIIIQRHEPLRSHFFEGPEVKINDTFDFKLIRHILDVEKGQNHQQSLLNLFKSFADIVFDLRTDLLIRGQHIVESESRSYLQLCVHHIAFDGWSMELLLNEFVSHYGCLITDQSLLDHELNISYVDYAYWQQRWLKTTQARNQLEYWLNQLSASPLVHGLPLDFPRPIRKRHEGQLIQKTFSRELTQQVINLAKTYKVSTFLLLHALLAWVFCRLSHAKEINVGIPVANRNAPEIANLIGFFANTLVLRSRLQGERFSDYLRHVKTVHVEAQSNQDIPFELLVEHSKVERSLQYAPLFQIMFSTVNRNAEEPSIDGVTIKALKFEQVQAKFDLEITTEIIDECLSVDWILDTSLFKSQSIENMHNMLVFVTQQVCQYPDVLLSKITLHNAEQKQAIMDASKGRAHKLDYVKGIHALIEHQAATEPDKTAVIAGQQQLTYQQLNQAANQCAHYLMKQGIKAGDLVGLSMGKSVDLAISVLAILKIGAAYVPVDAHHSHKRLQQMVNRCDLALMVSDKAINVLSVDVINFMTAEFTGFSQDNPEVEVDANNLAYIMHTSGTTGEPKGVAITHGSLINFMVSMSMQPGITKEDRLLSVTSPTFDIFGLELFLPLINGATVVFCGLKDSFDGGMIAKLLDQHEITVMQATPALWQLLCDSKWLGKANLKALSGGEAISQTLALQLSKKTKQLWNMYGPTETTIWSSCGRLSISESAESKHVDVNIGKPINNTQIYVLDEFMQPVPLGVAGQLFIAGEGLAKGYYRQDSLTDTAFVHHNFGQESTDAPTRLYATGDLGKYTLTGQLIHLGRLDDQIKIRGHRIESKEIELAFNKHPDIKDSLILLADNDQGSFKRTELLAYYTQKDTSAPPLALSVVRAHLADLLPPIMMPNRIIEIDSFPLNSSGKIDRSKLPKTQFVHNHTDKTHVPPNNRLEAIVLECLSNQIGTNKLGIHDNFFEAGASSIDLVRMADELKNNHDLKVSAIDLFQYPNTQKLVASLTEDIPKNHSRVKQLTEAKSRLINMKKRKINNA